MAYTLCLLRQYNNISYDLIFGFLKSNTLKKNLVENYKCQYKNVEKLRIRM